MVFNSSRFNSKIILSDRPQNQTKRDMGDIKRSIESFADRERDLNSVDILARSLAEIYGLGIEKEVFR